MFKDLGTHSGYGKWGCGGRAVNTYILRIVCAEWKGWNLLAEAGSAGYSAVLDVVAMVVNKMKVAFAISS